MTPEDFIAWVKDMVARHSYVKQQIIDAAAMAFDEIADGGSPDHEFTLAICEIKSLVARYIMRKFEDCADHERAGFRAEILRLGEKSDGE